MKHKQVWFLCIIVEGLSYSLGTWLRISSLSGVVKKGGENISSRIIDDISPVECALRCDTNDSGCRYAAYSNSKVGKRHCSLSESQDGLEYDTQSTTRLFKNANIDLSDVDECSNGTYKCDPNAKCINTLGSYVCVCRRGFTGDGENCTNINECKIGTHNCSKYFKSCTDTPGSFKCACIDRFAGNNYSCRYDFSIRFDAKSEEVPVHTKYVSSTYQSSTSCLWFKADSDGVVMTMSFGNHYCHELVIAVRNNQKSIEVIQRSRKVEFDTDSKMWTHLCIVRDYRSGYVYINNSRLYGVSMSGMERTPSGDRTFTLGNTRVQMYDGNCTVLGLRQAFIGEVKELYVWMRSLYSAELTSVFRSTSIYTSGLAMHWKLFRGKTQPSQTEVKYQDADFDSWP